MASSTSAVGSAPSIPSWRARLDGRLQVVALLTLVAVVGAIAGYRYLAGIYTPAGAAHQYLDSISAGRAAEAWQVMAVSAPTERSDGSLLDETALRAALATTRTDFGTITTGAYDPNRGVVAVSGLRKTGTVSGVLRLHRGTSRAYGLFDTWVVQVSPVLITLTVPAGYAGLAIDGRRIDVPRGREVSIAVLPLVHRVELLASPMLTAVSTEVDASTRGGSTLPLPALDATLTPAGVERAKVATAAALKACAASTDSAPLNCPQHLAGDFIVSWTLIGDAMSDFALGVTDKGLAGQGHFTMLATLPRGSGHSLSAGGYRSLLDVGQNEVTVTKIDDGFTGPPLTRPEGATDQAALNLIAPAMRACAERVGWHIPDCPQFNSAPLADDSHWILAGDPLQGATVTFDPVAGNLVVAGRFDMRARLGDSQTTWPSTTSRYKAYLIWTGSALQLVTIEGVL